MTTERDNVTPPAKDLTYMQSALLKEVTLAATAERRGSLKLANLRARRNAAIIEAVRGGIPAHRVAQAAAMPHASVYQLTTSQKCSVEGCENNVKARGMCPRHYAASRRKEVPSE